MAECKGYTQEFKFEAARLFEQIVSGGAVDSQVGSIAQPLYRLKVCILSLVTFAVGLAFFAAEAVAADSTYPTRTINMIVAYPARQHGYRRAYHRPEARAGALPDVPGYLHGRALKGIGQIYLHAGIDTFGSFAFGQLYTSKLPETAVDVLYDRTLPFYEARA